MPVYFARHISRDLMKIGWSEFPCHRVANMRLTVGEPAPFRLLGFVAGGRDLEREIHQQLTAHRVEMGRCREYFVASAAVGAATSTCSTVGAISFMRVWCTKNLAAVALSMRAFGGLTPWASALRWTVAEAALRADLQWCHAVGASKRLPADWRDGLKRLPEAA